MITAVLMIGDRLMKVTQVDGPVPYLRYAVSTMSTSTTTVAHWDISTATFAQNEIWHQELIFRRHGQIGPRQFEYQYEHVQGNNRFAVEIREHIEWGVQEPDGKVNLDKLAIKCKKRPNVKKLLLKFLRSR